ncbi:MAG: hypothetical protein UW46_C0004G0051 [Candidatus Yanofskybacteria bacterium GW2011_GWF1_44_227]|nr:MAG: hypothetical protein UW46_C0004G0051 [Candidatus Yanofskybacteria bacterium GW2011_GWF1_44_227]
MGGARGASSPSREAREEETAATMQELDSCGLPATDVEAVAAAAEKAKSSSLSDKEVRLSAIKLSRWPALLDWPSVMALAIAEGVVSVENAEKILTLTDAIAPTTPVVES